MAPRARSTPAVSAPMGSALDPFSPVLEPEDPRGEARGLDRIVRADRGPVHAAPGLGRAACAPRGLRHHLARPRDPAPELLRAQIHPPPRRRREPVSTVTGDRDLPPPVYPIALRREDGNAHGQNMTPQYGVPL